MSKAWLKSRIKSISGFRCHFEGHTDEGIGNRSRERQALSVNIAFSLVRLCAKWPNRMWLTIAKSEIQPSKARQKYSGVNNEFVSFQMAQICLGF